MNLDIFKAYGPDSISPRLIKEGGQKMYSLLTNLFNLSLLKKKVPLLWKRANVIPLYKKDDRSLLKNYRPVSLLSCVSKVFEQVIFKHLYNHFIDNY